MTVGHVPGFDEMLAKAVEDDVAEREASLTVVSDAEYQWGKLRTIAEAKRIAMDVAREREFVLQVKWISGEVLLPVYEKARMDFEQACDEWTLACLAESKAYDALTNYQQEDGADDDAHWETEDAKLRGGE